MKKLIPCILISIISIFVLTACQAKCHSCKKEFENEDDLQKIGDHNYCISCILTAKVDGEDAKKAFGEAADKISSDLGALGNEIGDKVGELGAEIGNKLDEIINNK